eukprot:gene17144-20555_t
MPAAEYRDRYLCALGHDEIALLADAVGASARRIGRQPIRYGLPAIAQAPGDAVAMGAAVDGHGETAHHRRVAGHRERGLVAITDAGTQALVPSGKAEPPSGLTGALSVPLLTWQLAVITSRA